MNIYIVKNILIALILGIGMAISTQAVAWHDGWNGDGYKNGYYNKYHNNNWNNNGWRNKGWYKGYNNGWYNKGYNNGTVIINKSVTRSSCQTIRSCNAYGNCWYSKRCY